MIEQSPQMLPAGRGRGRGGRGVRGGVRGGRGGFGGRGGPPSKKTRR